ncbi:MAG TPA: hypothetical protein PLF63_15655, partial [Rubrivivax sp.]|nr:hypothetical protein [Rubrivivax sp.]
MRSWGRRLCVLLLVLGVPLKSLAAAGVLACTLMGSWMGHAHGPGLAVASAAAAAMAAADVG